MPAAEGNQGTFPSLLFGVFLEYPDDPDSEKRYGWPVVQFISRGAVEVFADKNASKLWEFITSHGAGLGPYAGMLFEAAAIKVVELGAARLSMVPVGRKRPRVIMKKRHESDKKVTRVDVDDLVEAVRTGGHAVDTVLVPTQADFALVDAVLITDDGPVGLQMTLADSHDANAGMAEKLCTAMREAHPNMANKKFPLCWVVVEDQHKYDTPKTRDADKFLDYFVLKMNSKMFTLSLRKLGADLKLFLR